MNYQEVIEFFESQTISPKILNHFEDQILSQVDHFKELILLKPTDKAQKTLFSDYLRRGCEEAERSIETAIIEEHNSPNDSYTPNRVKLYQWNRERLRVLRLEFEEMSVPGNRKKVLQFHQLFHNPKAEERAIFILDIMEQNGFIKEGKWFNREDRDQLKKSIVIPFHVLRDSDVINKDRNLTCQLRAWCNELGMQELSEGDIKNFRSCKYDDDYNLWRERFGLLIAAAKQ